MIAIKLRRSLNLFSISLLLLFLVVSCNDNSTTPDQDPTLFELLEGETNYSTLASLLTDELIGQLETAELTVFAPTNSAFEAIPSDVLNALTEEQVVEIITFHLASGTFLSANLPEQTDLETVQGELILVQASNGVVINGSANVVDADLVAVNGVIHGINEVLLPSDLRKALGLTNLVDVAEEAGAFETLLGAVDATELRTTLQFLGPFTVFAPNDDAFGALPPGTIEDFTTDQLRNILLYHSIGAVVESTDLEPQQTVSSSTGEELYITLTNGSVIVNGSASVVAADITATNGVIHVIDEVLIPNEFLNIVQIAQKNYDLTTLVDLVVDQDLAETLSGDGPFTVFAPINSAFDEISDVLAGLSDDEVRDVLTYHVVGDLILSGDIPEGSTEIETLLGETITVVNENGTVTVNDAAVITVDLAGTNGVLHLIDAVLVP